MIDYTQCPTCFNEEESYIYGLLLTDGNLGLLERNRGKVSLELSYTDCDIIYELHQRIPSCYIKERHRETNFATEHHSIILTNHRLEFRKWLMTAGFPPGKKSDIIEPPTILYNEFAFWRGVIDGDGSLGITAQKLPFVSLVTASEKLAQSYMQFLKQHFSIEKHCNRNKRDNVYNIMINREDAQFVARSLYFEHNCCNLSLKRKYNKASEVLQWKRTTPKRSFYHPKPWDEKQEQYILTHSISDSMSALDRTYNSIYHRLRYLQENKKDKN